MRGQAWQLIMFFVLAIVFGTVYLLWTVEFKEYVQEQSVRDICEQSICQHAEPKCGKITTKISGTPAEQNRKLAEELRLCQKMMRCTSLDPGKYCHICSTVEFDDDSLKDFMKFVERAKPRGSTESYKDIFCIETMQSIAALSENSFLDTSSPLAVVYRYFREDDLEQRCVHLVRVNEVNTIDCNAPIM